MEVVSTQSASGETINHTKGEKMRSAKPKRLYSGRWGARVAGGDVEPDMLIRVYTRNGISWYSKVGNVLWQGPWDAICERTDISILDELNIEIPFLDQIRPAKESDKLLIGRIQTWVYSCVEDANGPAPFIEHYEYHEDYEIDCELYEFRAQGTIEDLTHSLLSPDPQTTQNGMNTGAEPRYQQESACDGDIRTRLWREHVRRQRERMPGQVAGLSDYSRSYGRDSAY